MEVQIMAMVLAAFLSPALPEGMIEVGQTSCEDAKAILQKQNLRLVDTEFLTDFDARTKLLVARPRQNLIAVQTLSWERKSTGLGGRGFSQGVILQEKSQSSPRWPAPVWPDGGRGRIGK